MKHRGLKIAVALLALTLFASGIVAAQVPAPAAEEPASAASTAPGGLEVALISIMLGGAMIFLFRPKRPNPED